MTRVMWKERILPEQAGTNDEPTYKHYDGMIVGMVWDGERVRAVVRLDTHKFVDIPLEVLNAND